MRKSIFLILICFILLSFTNVNATMAHNIYSNPRFSSNDKFDTFMIDFQGIRTPSYTYWALCNWQMDLDIFKQSYSNVSGGGAYAGLQTSSDNKRQVIMSFWEVLYDGGKSHRAVMIYPSGDTHSFGGEGEGSNFITPYAWETNKWYRMLIHSWNNPDTNTTYVAQWFYDIENDKWTLISVFDTKLVNSSLIGGFSQFQENYSSSTANEVREFNFKNMYLRVKETNNWLSLNSSELTYDTKAFGFDTAGLHEFGIRDNMFYGISGGSVDNQEVYDNSKPERSVLSIHQPNLPQISNPKVYLNIIPDNGNVKASWEYNAPQQTYNLRVVDNETNENVKTFSSVSASTNELLLDVDYYSDYTYYLDVTDVFGNTSKTKYKLEKKLENIEEKAGDKEKNTVSSNDRNKKIITPSKIENKKKSNMTFIVFIIIFIFLILLILFLFRIFKSKKNS